MKLSKQFCDLSGKLDKLNSHDDGQVLLRRQGPIGTTNAIQGWGSEKFIQSSRCPARGARIDKLLLRGSDAILDKLLSNLGDL